MSIQYVASLKHGGGSLLVVEVGAMHFELIREFQTFAITQNLSKASKELHITQSCLSKHMAELEAETGLRLINHDQKKVSLAPAGKYFAQETSSMLALWDDCLRCCKEIQKNAQGKSFSIAIFLEGNKANNVLFLLGKEYRKAHVGLEVSFSKLVSMVPVEALRKGAFDVTIDYRCGNPETCFTGEDYDGIAVLPLSVDSLVVWLRKDNRLAKKEKITLDELERVPIMTSVTNSFDYMREMTKDVFDRNEMVPFFKPVHFDIDSPASYFLSDFDSKCVMITSGGMVENQCLSMRDDITYRVIEDPRLRATAYMLALETNKRAAAFFEFARSVL